MTSTLRTQSVLTKLVLAFTFIGLFCGCGTRMNIRKSQLRYFDNHLAMAFSNYAYKVKGERYSSPSLLRLLEIQPDSANKVKLAFNEKDELVLLYSQYDSLKTKVIAGHFAKRGYYEIYLHNESKEIPPVVPILFARYNINRIRLAISNDSSLIVENSWMQGGHIFILAAGDGGTRLSFFKPIE